MIEIVRRYRLLIFILGIATTVFFIVGITKVEFGVFRNLPLPETDPASQANRMMGDRFGGLETITFIVESEDILSRQSLQVVKELSEDIKEIAAVNSPQDVLSIATLSIPEAKPGSSEISVKPFLDELPETQEQREALSKKISENPLIEQFLINKSRKAALVSAYIGERAYPDGSLTLPEFLTTHQKEVNALIQKHTKPGISILATSAPLVMTITQERTKVELALIGTIAVSLMLLVFYLSFRSARNVLLAFLTKVLATLWTFGAMGWWHIPITPSSIYIVIIILSVGSSYSIHVITNIENRFSFFRNAKNAVALGINDIANPLFTVAVTAVLSGISLLTFDIPDIRELGIFQAMGIALCYAFAFFLIPHFIFSKSRSSSERRKPKRLQAKIKDLTKVDKSINWALSKFIWIPLNKRHIALVITVLLAVFSIVGSSRVTANWIVEEGIPKNSLPRLGYDHIISQFGYFRTASVVVEAANKGTLLNPKSFEDIAKLQDDLSKIPGIKVLPTLVDAFKKYREFFHGSSGLPQNKEEIDQFLLLAGRKKLARLLDSSSNVTLINLVIKTSKPKEISAIIKTIQDQTKRIPSDYKAALGGPPVVVDSINKYIVSNKVESIVACLLIVLTACSLINISLTLGLVSVLPSALAAMMTFAIMGYAQIPLDIGTATITTIAIGVGVDFAVHYLLQFKQDFSRYISENKIESTDLERANNTKHYREVLKRTTQRYGRTIVFDALSNILGFTPLLISQFPILRVSGLLLVANQVLVVLTTFFLTPLLLLIFRPELPKYFQESLEYGQEHFIRKVEQ